ncbi:hypothetical protein HYX11_04295 [Candidatus Woesearchaeota archaeon]|nr:hypothetical protein [Candidatus Woesearchaeota archaeon]
MNKKASTIIEFLLILVAVVLTSAVILFLVQKGVVTVKADTSPQPILNTEFIPFAREGTLSIKEFQFCQYVDEQYQCLEPKQTFVRGEEVHFRFVVESTTSNGVVKIVENYRITSPSGQIILDANTENNFDYDTESNKNKESLVFKDYFTLGFGLQPGTYSLDLILENPYLIKQVTYTKTFIVK